MSWWYNDGSSNQQTTTSVGFLQLSAGDELIEAANAHFDLRRSDEHMDASHNDLDDADLHLGCKSPTTVLTSLTTGRHQRRPPPRRLLR